MDCMARGASRPRDARATQSLPACESIRRCVRGSCRGVAGQGYVAQPVRGAGKVLCSGRVGARAETREPGKPRSPHPRGVLAAVGENKRESERDSGFAATPQILLAPPRPPPRLQGEPLDLPAGAWGAACTKWRTILFSAGGLVKGVRCVLCPAPALLPASQRLIARALPLPRLQGLRHPHPSV